MDQPEVGEQWILRGEGINKSYQGSTVEIRKVNVEARTAQIVIVYAPNGGSKGANGRVDWSILHRIIYTNKDAKRFLMKR